MMQTVPKSERQGKRDQHCPTCGELHSRCKMPGCENRTRCPVDEPAEPFAYCDACDAELANPEGQVTP